MEELDLRGIADRGYVRFSIRADDTEENKKVHDAFKEFCKAECDNNYTLGLRKLIENYESDYRYESLWERIVDIDKRVSALETKPVIDKPAEIQEAF